MPLVRGGYAPTNPEWLLAGSPDTRSAPRANMSRYDAASDAAALTTQVLTTVALALQAGDIVTKIACKSGATAAGTPTNYWFALYDPSGNLLQQTADQTTTAWAADTAKDLALAAAVPISASGTYYVGIMVKATTPPSLVGVTLGRAGVTAGILATDKIASQTSGSGLTATAPATIATPTAIAAVPLVIAH